MKSVVSVNVHFEVESIDDIRRISKLCSNDKDFVCIGINGLDESTFNELRKMVMNNNEKIG